MYVHKTGQARPDGDHIGTRVLIGTLDRLGLPVCPVDVVTGNGQAVWVWHLTDQDATEVTAQIRTFNHLNKRFTMN